MAVTTSSPSAGPTPSADSASTSSAAAGTRRRRPLGGRRPGSHLFLFILSVYFVLPLWWLVVAATKSTSALFNGTGGPLWFDHHFNLWTNLQQLSSRGHGLYWQWLGNSFLYALSAGVGATVLAVLAGYGFATFRFKGRDLAFSVLLGSVMVPSTALVIPTFVMLSKANLTDTPWAVILPSLLNPLGVYLMRVYIQDAVPVELLEAARVDGAGEVRTFFGVALPLLKPAIITVLLLSVVGVWNNYFLPLAMLSNPRLLPVTVGLGTWQAQSTVGAGGEQLWNLVVTGALVSIVPLLVSFLSLQRFWRGGLALGAVK